MTHNGVLVLGETAVDVIVQCGSAAIDWGQAERLVDDTRIVLGSSGAITAAAAATLGLEVAFAGVVGDDFLGDFFVTELARLGVDTGGVLRSVHGRTGVTVVLERYGDRAMLTYPGTMGAHSVGDVQSSDLSAYGHVHVSSYFLQSGLQVGLASLLAEASRAGATTSLDPGWDPSEAWDHGLVAVLGQLDWLLPNEAEAVAIAGRCAPASGPGLDGEGETGPPEATHEKTLAALSALGCGVVVKLGGAGAVARHGGHTTYMATTPLDPLDTTGAGDCFDAGFIAGIVSGQDPVKAVAWGLACGRTAIGGIGGTGRLATRSEAAALADELINAMAVGRSTDDGRARPVTPGGRS